MRERRKSMAKAKEWAEAVPCPHCGELVPRAIAPEHITQCAVEFADKVLALETSLDKLERNIHALRRRLGMVE